MEWRVFPVTSRNVKLKYLSNIAKCSCGEEVSRLLTQATMDKRLSSSDLKEVEKFAYRCVGLMHSAG